MIFPPVSRQKIDSIRGADPEALESKVQELGGDKPKVEAVMVDVIASSKNTNSNASTGGRFQWFYAYLVSIFVSDRIFCRLL